MRSDSSITQDLLDKVHTKEQADLLLGEIETMLPSVNRVKTQTFEDVLKKSVRSEIATIIEAIFKKYNIPLQDDSGKIKYFLEAVRQTLTRAKIVSLTLSFEPDDSAIVFFSEWAKKSLTQPVVFEITHDRRILGGALISYQGLYRNYSLLKKIDNYFAPEIETKQKQLAQDKVEVPMLSGVEV